MIVLLLVLWQGLHGAHKNFLRKGESHVGREVLAEFRIRYAVLLIADLKSMGQGSVGRMSVYPSSPWPRTSTLCAVAL